LSVSLKIIFHQARHLAFFGVAPGLLFGINQGAVHVHFKAPAVRGDQADRFGFGLVLLQQFGRQTGGPVGVVSDRAVLNGNFQ
jgi:hypothetical protein